MTVCGHSAFNWEIELKSSVTGMLTRKGERDQAYTEDLVKTREEGSAYQPEGSPQTKPGLPTP